VKWQLASYPLGEVAFGRTLFAFLTAAAIVLPRAGWGVLRTRRYREHLQRGLSQFGSMLCWFLAVSVLSLGSARRRRSASRHHCSRPCDQRRPGVDADPLLQDYDRQRALTYGALFALGNAVLISTVAIAIRRMSMTESAETLTLYQMSIMTLCVDAEGFATPDLVAARELLAEPPPSEYRVLQSELGCESSWL
jgi:drug/metabolite transporter (DMT)-like permease